MMPSYYWLKLWIDILDDWKVAPLPDRLWRRFVECCLIAKKVDDGGYLPEMEKMAFILRTEPDTLQTDLAALEQATSIGDKPGVIQYIEGRWFVTNLEKRQRNMTATERKRKQRERDRAASHDRHVNGTKSDLEDRGQRTEDQTTEDQTTDNRPRDAADLVAAVLALKTFGMSQPEKVMAETEMPPGWVVDTVRYANQEKLGCGWVRTQLRENRHHRPRAPAVPICPTCSQHPCGCEEIEFTAKGEVG